MKCFTCLSAGHHIILPLHQSQPPSETSKNNNDQWSNEAYMIYWAIQYSDELILGPSIHPLPPFGQSPLSCAPPIITKYCLVWSWINYFTQLLQVVKRWIIIYTNNSNTIVIWGILQFHNYINLLWMSHPWPQFFNFLLFKWNIWYYNNWMFLMLCLSNEISGTIIIECF